MTMAAASALGLWPGLNIPTISGTSSLSTGSTLDASGEKFAIMIKAPRAMNLSRFWLNLGSVSANAAFRARVEQVDDSVLPARPNGTLLAAGAEWTGNILTSNANGAMGFLLGTACPLAAGDYFAVVLESQEAGSHSVVVRRYGNGAIHHPHCHNFVGGSWSGSPPYTSYHFLGLEADDGTFCEVLGCFPVDSITTETFANSDNPNQRGNQFRVPGKWSVRGIWAQLDLDVGETCQVAIYDGADTLVAGSLTTVIGNRKTGSSLGFWPILFDASVVLNPDVDYKMVAYADSANTVGLEVQTLVSAGAREACWGGIYTSYCTRNGTSGVFTVDQTKKSAMGLIFDAADKGDGAGGGGVTGVSVLTGGGMIR